MSDPADRGTARRPSWRAPLLWAAVLLAATSWPNPDVPRSVSHLDKVVHALLYGVLAWLVARAEPRATATVRGFLVTGAAVAVVAAFDEWHQAFVPGRSVSFDDWMADVLGALAALLLFVARRRLPAAA